MGRITLTSRTDLPVVNRPAPEGVSYPMTRHPLSVAAAGIASKRPEACAGLADLRRKRPTGVCFQLK
jgi:hypothetical protein